ncbi:MAG: hypothetical protein LUC38_03100 [Oscillospiraceae bacterium]|nr:hypothetical protein [Ruminococcus sp.]MCD8344931.1 hypothetical protein [Oscillospiraceae bacterium]
MKENPIVFVITPFNDDFLALYDELKEEFKESFTFTNAGDLDSQQSIIKDIVWGIYKADVIIADLTGLNANVFYELGLAHAMNKKVIIITQNLEELPFDIRSYRANEYSLKFNKLPELIDKLKDLLFGAIDGSVEYGNPVYDYIPNYCKIENDISSNDYKEYTIEQPDNEPAREVNNEGEAGFLDYIDDIKVSSEKMTNEILSIGTEMSEVSTYWNTVENGYLSLLDNNFTKSTADDVIISDHFPSAALITARTAKRKVKAIIVTGRYGFIGSNFIFHLLKTHPNIVVNFATDSHVDCSIEDPEKADSICDSKCPLAFSPFM